MRTIADSIDVTKLPTNVNGYAGYVNGKWPTFSHLPKAVTHWSIDVIGDTVADWLDIETGDAQPEDFAEWPGRLYGKGVYCTPSNWAVVKTVCQTYGLPIPPWWAAHPGPAEIYPGSVATQYGGKPDRYDLTIALDFIPNIDPENRGNMILVRDPDTQREYLLTEDRRLTYLKTSKTVGALAISLGHPPVDCDPSDLASFDGYVK